MTFREWLIIHDACEEAREWVGDRTVEQAWAECPRSDWMIWLVYELTYDTATPGFDDRFMPLYSNIVRHLDEFWGELRPSWIAASKEAGFRRAEASALLSRLKAAFIRSIQPTAPGPEAVMAEESLSAIYEILVKEVGANPLDSDSFVRHYASPQAVEWRFCGTLGYGGKFYRNAGRHYVQCYREDETRERRRTIERVNKLLARYDRTVLRSVRTKLATEFQS